MVNTTEPAAEPKRIDPALGKRFQQALDYSGVKQAAIARACDVSPQAVNKWPRTGNIAREHISTICDMCKVDYRWFLTGKGEMRPGNPLASMDEDEIITLVLSRLPPAGRARLLQKLALFVEQELALPR